MNRYRAVLLDTIKKNGIAITVAVLFLLCSSAVYYLYGLPAEPFLYADALIVFSIFAALLFAYIRELRKAETRMRLLREALIQPISLPQSTLEEADYADTVRRLQEEVTSLRNEALFVRQDEIDYYTAWVHQIKTPIAVMRMMLGNGESENDSTLKTELFRIEQYVDMALTYIRLGGGSDLVIREYQLDELIRETVRKFAPQFVFKKLQLNYDGTDTVIITDKKWFSCILEQLLSNAIKYTPSGSISIAVHDDRLTVSDTGIGIAASDVPRIFEKGFTGENGRTDKRASGLGLYLCKKSADLLQIPLSVESIVSSGTVFTIDLVGKTVQTAVKT